MKNKILIFTSVLLLLTSCQKAKGEDVPTKTEFIDVSFEPLKKVYTDVEQRYTFAERYAELLQYHDAS